MHGCNTHRLHSPCKTSFQSPDSRSSCTAPAFCTGSPKSSTETQAAAKRTCWKSPAPPIARVRPYPFPLAAATPTCRCAPLLREQACTMPLPRFRPPRMRLSTPSIPGARVANRPLQEVPYRFRYSPIHPFHRRIDMVLVTFSTTICCGRMTYGFYMCGVSPLSGKGGGFECQALRPNFFQGITVSEETRRASFPSLQAARTTLISPP